MDCCVFPVFMALLRYFSLCPGRNCGVHRFCSLKVLFCCGPGQPHGSALFVQTLERFVLSVTGESRGFLFFCSPPGGGGQAPGPLLRCFGRGIRNCLGSGCRIRFKLDSGMELFILFCPLDGAGAWEQGGAACIALLVPERLWINKITLENYPILFPVLPLILIL